MFMMTMMDKDDDWDYNDPCYY